MKIRVTKLEDVMVKDKYPAYKIYGDSMKDGAPKTRTIFKNQEELVKKIESFVSAGAEIEIVLVQNGKWYDVTDIIKLSGGSGDSGGSSNSGGGDNEYTAMKNRGVALSYAVKDVMPQINSVAKLNKMSADEYTKQAFDIADKLVGYVSGQAEAEVDPRSLLDDDAPDDDDDQPNTPAPPE